MSIGRPTDVPPGAPIDGAETPSSPFTLDALFARDPGIYDATHLGSTEETETPSASSLPEFILAATSVIDSGLDQEVVDIAYWGNYILAIPEDQQNLKVFDRNGTPVEDFNKLSRIVLAFIFPENPPGKEYISRDAASGDRKDLIISNYPVFINTWFSQNNSTSKYISIEALRNQFEQQKYESKWRINIINNGKYIILFHPSTKYFIAYRTLNDSGDPLPPRNWTRFDSSRLQRFPDDLEDAIIGMQNRVEGKIISINADREVEITDTVITIRDNSGPSLFTDQVDFVRNNLCVDPHDSDVIYYCRSQNPVEIIKLEMKGHPKSWKPVAAKLPICYGEIHGLQMDPTGNFFTFSVPGRGLIIVSCDTLEEVGDFGGLRHVSFDNNGDVRAMNEQNQFVVFRSNLNEIARAAKARRITAQLEGLGDLFKDVAGPGVISGSAVEAAQAKDFTYLDTNKEKFERSIIPVIAKATTLAELQKFAKDLDTLRTNLNQSGLSPEEVNYMTVEIGRFISQKEHSIASDEVFVSLAYVRAKIPDLRDITTAAELRQQVNDLQGIVHLLDDTAHRQVDDVTSQVTKETARIFRERGNEIVADVQGLMKSVEAELQSFDRKADFDDWVDYRLPQLKQKIANISNECPPELFEVNQELLAARQKLNTLKDIYEEKFKVAYAQVREQAASKNEETAGVLNDDIEGLLERLRGKRFSSRIQAEQYIGDSPAYQQLFAEIQFLAGKDPDRAAELDKKLKVQLAIVFNEIERGSNIRIAETGQQMVKFGEMEFPKWEGHIQEKVKHMVVLTWIPDERSKGAGMGPQDMYGDIGLRITDSHGRIKIIRLYQHHDDESDRRYGNLIYRGVAMPPTYMKQKDFRALQSAYSDWQKGEQSTIRKILAEKLETLHAIYLRGKPKGAKHGDAAYMAWVQDPARKSEYEAALKDYADFCAANHIVILQAFDRAKASPNIETGNGKGYVPEWASHWVLDNDTEKYLEEMGEAFKMQLDLQEGLVLLKGHAGTGKDVLMKMFCERTRRPYFAIDCTKWTTEFELSEDITLEAEDGASRTVPVPSTVLNAIQTPGAVMYFNEINAMPEQAQIFLHALMDEKRAITLKTKSGKTIKADKTVLLAASMNPGYPGTFDPQMATRSRTVSLHIDYPSMMREKTPGDPNPNQPYNASEALRIARGVKSLADFTYDPDMKRNQFVHIWDNAVNGVHNGAAALSAVQKFDLETILALIQFSNNLRTEFIKKFEKGPDAREALPVTQPVTGREMRRCAYMLSQVPESKKVKSNPEKMARELLVRFFLTHIDRQQDRNKIEQAMARWTSSKRVAI